MLASGYRRSIELCREHGIASVAFTAISTGVYRFPVDRAAEIAVAAVAEAIQARDLSDQTRAASPLSLAPGATHIDTTDMPIDAVVDHVLALVRERMK